MRGMRLYHGSNEAVKRPDVSMNTGFADLGRGFYLTDQYEVACHRAMSRARRVGGTPVVSIFDLDEGCVPWVEWGVAGRVARTETGQASSDTPAGQAFGLCFEESAAGIAAWADYIKACRTGLIEVPGWGEPALVRAWIATEEIEMACSGLVSAEDLAGALDPSELVAQVCVLSQELADGALSFEAADYLAR